MLEVILRVQVKTDSLDEAIAAAITYGQHLMDTCDGDDSINQITYSISERFPEVAG